MQSSFVLRTSSRFQCLVKRDVVAKCFFVFDGPRSALFNKVTKRWPLDLEHKDIHQEYPSESLSSPGFLKDHDLDQLLAYSVGLGGILLRIAATTLFDGKNRPGVS